MPRLNDWAYVREPSNSAEQHAAPEAIHPRLRGVCTGHVAHADGTRVKTGTVVGRLGDLVVTAGGTKWELGDPEAAYEAAVP